MNQSRLTLNLKCNRVADWGKTRAFIKRLNPVSVVACIDSMNDRNRILELQQDNPQTKVIARMILEQHDGAMHLAPQTSTDRYVVSPGNFLNSFGELGKNGLTLYCLNEPSGEVDQDTIGRLVQWTIETINLANQRGISLCVLNWGVGHPRLINNDTEWDARFDDVLALLSKHRNTHYLGMHLYSPADTFRRLDAMLARCKKINGGIIPPRVVITEFGFDTHGGSAQNGYKTRGLTGEQYAAWQIDHIRNVYSPYIQRDELHSVATFIWGDSVSWQAFDVETDTGWQDAILQAKDAGKLTFESKPSTAPLTPNYTPIDRFEAGKTYKLSAPGAVRNVRDIAGISGQRLGTVSDGQNVVVREEKIVGIDYWWKIETETLTGWISLDGGTVKMLRQPDVVIVTPPAPFVEISAQKALALSKMHTSMAESYEALAADYRRLAAEWKAVYEQTRLDNAA